MIEISKRLWSKQNQYFVFCTIFLCDSLFWWRLNVEERLRLFSVSLLVLYVHHLATCTVLLSPLRCLCLYLPYTSHCVTFLLTYCTLCDLSFSAEFCTSVLQTYFEIVLIHKMCKYCLIIRFPSSAELQVSGSWCFEGTDGPHLQGRMDHQTLADGCNAFLSNSGNNITSNTLLYPRNQNPQLCWCENLDTKPATLMKDKWSPGNKVLWGHRWQGRMFLALYLHIDGT
jgi:hypothetical protein